MGVQGVREGVRLLVGVMWHMRGHGEGGGVTLRGTGGEVGEEAGAQGVTGVQALHGAKIAGNLRHTFSETQRQEVQSQSVGVQITYRRPDRQTDRRTVRLCVFASTKKSS